ncbi:uncharacterized protein [Montipora capricornis]|uniref:uncharacterized protein n=1 Tax=Montipora capricornis TaxID=246305 RepID=UPI0035F1ED75
MEACIFAVAILFMLEVGIAKAPSTTEPSEDPTTASQHFHVPQPAIIFLSFLGGCLVFVFILYKILHSDFCKMDRDKLSGTKRANYVELGQSPVLAEEAIGVDDSTDFMEQETTASEKSAKYYVEQPWGNETREKSRSMGDLLPEKPAKSPPRRKLTTWDRPAIEAVKAVGYMSVLSAYGDGTSPKDSPISPRKLRGSRGEIICVAKLQISVSFSQTAQRLEVTVIRVQDFPESISHSSATSAMSVHLTLMPSKRYRFKTKTKATSDVTINETFVMRGVTEKELMDSTLRFRIYAQAPMKKAKLIGETETHVTDFDLDDIVSTMWIMVPPVTVAEQSKTPKTKQPHRK